MRRRISFFLPHVLSEHGLTPRIYLCLTTWVQSWVRVRSANQHRSRSLAPGLFMISCLLGIVALVPSADFMMAADVYRAHSFPDRSMPYGEHQFSTILKPSLDSPAEYSAPVISPSRLLLELSRAPSEAEIDELISIYNLEQMLPLSVGDSEIWIAEMRVDGVFASNALADQTALIASMAQHELVLTAEADIIFSAYGHRYATRSRNASTIPNDSFYDEQWALTAVNAAGAWGITTGSTDVVIAVLDSGVDSQHPDLSTNLGEGYDFIGDDSEPQDDLGHGTHVVSVIGGTSNNGIGVAGVNWDVEIMPIKVLDSAGFGSVSNIIQGINWAVEHGADVINLSLGSPDDSVLLRRTVRRVVQDSGVVVVAASGNEYEDGNQLSYPAAYDEVIAVGATDQDGVHAPFSSSGSHLTVAAPGVQILAATWTGSGGEYAYYTGTSMSAPIVAGIVGLMLAVNNELSPAEIASILTRTAQDVGDPGYDSLTGHGIVDAEAAVRSVASTIPTSTPTNTPRPTAAPTSIPTSTSAPIDNEPTSAPTARATTMPTPTPVSPEGASSESAGPLQFEIFVPLLH